MGEKKKSDGENNNNNNNVVLKVDMHCDGCASKIIRYLRAFPGVETVKVESETGKITITGKVDPTKLKENLGKKTKKKVELVSPQPKKEKENNKDDNKKPEKKNNDDKKPKDKEKEPPVTTAVLKVALHCQGCLDKIRKTVSKTKGVHEMSIDKQKETVTVKGTMDVKALVGNLMDKLKRKVEVVPPKKDKDNNDNKENNGGEKEGSGKKKNKGGGGGDGNNEEGGGKMMEQNRMEYLPPAHLPFPPFGFGYGPQFHGHGHGHGGNVGNVGGYSYGPVYPEHMHLHHAPQMFSDENPNACSVM